MLFTHSNFIKEDARCQYTGSYVYIQLLHGFAALECKACRINVFPNWVDCIVEKVGLLQIITKTQQKKMSLFRSFRTLRPILGAFKTTNKPLIRPFSISRPFFDNNSGDSIQKQGTQGFDEPIPIRIHEVTPNPLPKSLAPTHPEDMENYWLTMPTLFERAVGSERAELLNPHIYDELLVCLLVMYCVHLF
jgi:hypothetical protein